MNEREMFVKTEIKEPEVKPEAQEGVQIGETEKGTKALEDMNKAIGLDLNNVEDSIKNNPEMVIKKAEKNPEFKKKLKTFIGVTGLVLGVGAVAYSFGNPEEMSVALRELSRIFGLSASGASAVYLALGEKIRNIKVPDSVAKFFEDKK